MAPADKGGGVSTPLAHRTWGCDPGGPQEKTFETLGAGNEPVGPESATPAAVEALHRAQLLIGMKHVARQAVPALNQSHPHDIVRARSEPHDRSLAFSDARKALRHESPVFLRIPRGANSRARCGKELVIAAAGVDRIVDERLPVGCERHAPCYAVQAPGKEIDRAVRRTFGKPDCVNQLEQHPLE